MTNLLAQIALRVRKRELWARSAVLVLVCGSLLALSSLALALSVYATEYVDARIDADALTRAQHLATQANAQGRRAEITNLRDRVKKILSTQGEGTRTEELAFIGSEQSPGISVRGIQIAHTGTQPSRITLALSAKQRTQLLTFIDLLRGDAHVTRIEYPTSALVKSSDISTTISFSYTHMQASTTNEAPTL